MKYTEGYWLRKESVRASFAAEIYQVREIPGGLRLTLPEKAVKSRAEVLDQTVLTMDIVSAGKNDISVTLMHYMAYDSHEPRFELELHPEETELEITEEEAVLRAGEITVRCLRHPFEIRFEAGGRILTSCGFRNAGYLRKDYQPTSFEAGQHYFQACYEPYLLTELSLKPGECIYGFGEQFTEFVKNGQTVEIWQEDGGTASSVAYKNVPFYMSSEHYGIFVDSSDHVSFEVGSEKVAAVGFTVPGESLRYHLFYGKEPRDILKAYTALTGRPPLVPEWSFGLWLSTSFKPRYDEKTVTEMIQGMAQRGIPLSVFHFDCFWMKPFHLCDFGWDEKEFPDVSGMLQRYHEMGLHLCCWINPYVAQDTEMFEEGVRGGYFLMRADGHGVKQVDNWQPGQAIVDFTNPEAAAWFAGKVKALLETGIDCLKTDFGERIPIDVSYHDGSDPRAMHNFYTLLYNRTIYEAIQSVRGENEAVLFARSATAGSQKYPVHWGGDSTAAYASMAETLRAGLSFAASGFAYWSHDISGFEATASPDLYKRWVQFGLLSSHSRLHGSDTVRVPWAFDEEASEVLRTFTSLKCHLMPYLYGLALEASKTGSPIMRPMFFEFPEDPGCRKLDLQYMLGGDLLVAPIFNERGEAEFYLPEGCCWTNLLDGEILEGGRWYRRVYDYFHLPLFVRGGSMLPYGGCGSRPDYDYTEDLTLKIFQPEKLGETEVRIPDREGKVVLTASACLKDGDLCVRLSPAGGVKLSVCLEDGEIQAEIRGDGGIIHLAD